METDGGWRKYYFSLGGSEKDLIPGGDIWAKIMSKRKVKMCVQ